MSRLSFGFGFVRTPPCALVFGLDVLASVWDLKLGNFCVSARENGIADFRIFFFLSHFRNFFLSVAYFPKKGKDRNEQTPKN